MTQSLLTIALFMGLLIAVPFVLRRVQHKRGLLPGGTGLLGGLSGMGGAAAAAAGPSRLLSSIAIGPQQRVVTVEVGSPDARTLLVLGVTGQSITCLHTVPWTPPGTGTPESARP